MGGSSSRKKLKKRKRRSVRIVCVYCEAIKVDVGDKEKSMVEKYFIKYFLCILLFDIVKIRSNLIKLLPHPLLSQPNAM